MISVTNHGRALKYRALEIHRLARCLTHTNRQRMANSYAKLLRIAGRVIGQARRVSRAVALGDLLIDGREARVRRWAARIDHFAGLLGNVVSQTKQRVFGGNNRAPEKIVSLFEEHTQIIRKGKAHKPTEFGRLVRIDEVENGIVSNYAVKEGNSADSDDWVPALESHEAAFGHVPQMACADRGYYSARNERAAHELGVRNVVLPARGRASPSRATRQKKRSFKKGMRWRAGIENRIATLKHCFGMKRALYKGAEGMERCVGWAVIAQNLVSIARFMMREETQNGL